MNPGDQSTGYHSANYFGRPIHRLVDQFDDRTTNRRVNNRLMKVKFLIIPRVHRGSHKGFLGGVLRGATDLILTFYLWSHHIGLTS